MSDCMIIRRGGGRNGFDKNGAVLKVVTSTGCSVTVTNSNAGYSETRQSSDGFPRGSDSSVIEHFFSIPSSAFGTFSVEVSKAYSGTTLTANKSLSVNSAGKVFEVLIGAPNIILNSTFGFQTMYTLPSNASYDETTKTLSTYNIYGTLLSGVPTRRFTKLKCTAMQAYNQSGSSGSITLSLSGSYTSQCTLSPYNNMYAYQTLEGSISNRTADTSNLNTSYISRISEIVLT